MGLSGVGLAVCLRSLAPSERYAQERGRRHKPLTEWAWQMLLLVRRWHPQREIVAVADGGYASLKLLDRCRHLGRPITFITRLRLDAALYEPAPPRKPKQMGRPRLKGSRLANLSAVLEDPKTAWTPITLSSCYGGAQGTVEIVSETAIWYSTGLPAVPIRWVLIRDPEGDFESQALLCTDLSADSARIISWFVRRLSDGVHLSRSSSAPGLRDPEAMVGDGYLKRTAPALLRLFSADALFAHQRKVRMPQAVRRAAWYEKEHPTFSEALALVRKELWAQQEATFCGSREESETVKVPRAFMERLTDAVCYAA